MSLTGTRFQLSASMHVPRKNEIIVPAKPKVFVGSSKESLPVLRIIQRELKSAAQVVAWTAEENWEIGRFTLESLIARSQEFDFAVLIFAGDDEVISRGQDYVAPRDNVVFELGLFMSRLDRDRTLIVTPRGVKLLSDISGLNPGYYEAPPRKRKESDAAYERRLLPGLRRTIEQLRDRLEQVGLRAPLSPTPTAGPRDVHDVGRALDEVLQQRIHRPTVVRNLALDMEATWGVLRDRILSSNTRLNNLTWRSLMVDPEGDTMKTMGSSTVSRAMAETRIREMRSHCPKTRTQMASRSIDFACRAYSALPVFHGFMIDDDVLLMSMCNVVKGRLDGAATPYWRFEANSAHPQTDHLFKCFRNWFDQYWRTGRKIWPLKPT